MRRLVIRLGEGPPAVGPAHAVMSRPRRDPPNGASRVRSHLHSSLQTLALLNLHRPYARALRVSRRAAPRRSFAKCLADAAHYLSQEALPRRDPYGERDRPAGAAVIAAGAAANAR